MYLESVCACKDVCVSILLRKLGGDKHDTSVYSGQLWALEIVINNGTQQRTFHQCKQVCTVRVATPDTALTCAGDVGQRAAEADAARRERVSQVARQAKDSEARALTQRQHRRADLAHVAQVRLGSTNGGGGADQPRHNHLKVHSWLSRLVRFLFCPAWPGENESP